MIDLAIVVEGPTEEGFVQRVLAPALWPHGVGAWPVLPGRARRRRGGVRRWSAIRSDVTRLLRERRDRYCAILFDYYGMPHDWPGRERAAQGRIADRGSTVEASLVSDLQDVMGEAFDPGRFVPHVQLHEYEARLFADCSTLATVVGVAEGRLRAIVDRCGSPEEIDDGAQTAPSKRLQQECPGYEKFIFGVAAAERIGLGAMRQVCPHFGGWLDRLESMARR